MVKCLTENNHRPHVAGADGVVLIDLRQSAGVFYNAGKSRRGWNLWGGMFIYLRESRNRAM